MEEKRKIVWMFINAIPIERKVNADFYFDPFLMFLEKPLDLKNQTEGLIQPSVKLVAGAFIQCSWTPDFKPSKLTTNKVIEFVKYKQEFTRLDLEEKFKLSTGRAYWHVKNLMDKKLIKKTTRTLNLQDKGRVYAIYKVKT